MSDYFVIFLTADNCAHCVNTRGNGVLNDGKILNGSSFLKQILKFNTSIINIHYQQMMATKSSIKDISKYTMNKEGFVIQEKYYNFKNDARLEVLKESSTTTTRIYNDYIKKDKDKVKWLKFIDDKISNKILNYAFYFPCFLLLNKNNWKESLKDGNVELMALANAGFTIKHENGVIGIKKDKSVHDRNIDIIPLIEGVIKGEIPFEVHEDKNINKDKNIKNINKDKNINNINKDKNIKMKDFIEYKDVIIRGFD